MYSTTPQHMETHFDMWSIVWLNTENDKNSVKHEKRELEREVQTLAIFILQPEHLANHCVKCVQLSVSESLIYTYSMFSAVLTYLHMDFLLII